VKAVFFGTPIYCVNSETEVYECNHFLTRELPKLDAAAVDAYIITAVPVCGSDVEIMPDILWWSVAV